jgi:hypothetical protein
MAACSYRRLALKLHPDVDATEDAARDFGAISEAYDVLSNRKGGANVRLLHGRGCTGRSMHRA